MSELSFGIKNSSDLLTKLIDEYIEFEDNILSSRLAINLAMTAWHLAEWVYHEFYSIRDEEEYLKDLKKQCPSLKIMHDITNGSKHFKLREGTKKNTKVKSTDKSNNDFARGDFALGDFEVEALIIKMKNDETKYFEIEIKTVIDFWKEYFSNNLEGKLN